MSKIRQALRLYTQEKSKMFIKEHTGLSRNTVKKYINLFIESKLTFDEVNKLSDKDLDELFGYNPQAEPTERLKQLIECFPAISRKYQ